MIKLLTNVVRIVATSILIVINGSAAAQQTYPSKPIRLISPYAPGGGNDLVARLIAQKLSESWGQQVLVENRSGGNTIIGTDALAKSQPDGYTIMLTSNTHVISPSLMPKLPYDTIKDFAPIATVSNLAFVLVIHPSVQANNLKEFIALAKARPGQLNFASSGSGSPTHLAGELLNITAGIKLQHIPYKGTGPALTDLIGGQVQAFFSSPAAVIPHIKNSSLKAIAVSGETRLTPLPQVVTFAEGGLPGLDVNTWQGVLAPAGTPKEIINKLSSEIARIMAMPDIMEKLVSQGLEPFYSTPDQFSQLLRTDLAKFAKVIRSANIKLEQ